MKMIPTREANASSVNLVKYLNFNIEKGISRQNVHEFSNLTMAEPSTATMTMQKRADQRPIQRRMVR